jgi:hypothetical protein
MIFQLLIKTIYIFSKISPQIKASSILSFDEEAASLLFLWKSIKKSPLTKTPTLATFEKKKKREREINSANCQ